MTDRFEVSPPLVPLAARLTAARAAAAASLAAGVGGVEIAEDLTAAIESIVDELARARLVQAGLADDGSGVALLITGGFGRREMAPHSDLDLLFLCAGEPDAAIEDVARGILMPLWDAKLDAGHAVRSEREALELPRSDLTAATALLDARFVVGDRTMADRILAQFRQSVSGVGEGSLVARLRQEQATRHTRFGDTIFLLEPDLKSGPGGLRDLCAGRWAAQARFGSSDPQALVHMRVMSPRQAVALEGARSFGLRVRTALHLAAGRRQDQLKFDLQEKIAPLLYPNVRRAEDDWRAPLAPVVEALMHDFQRHAKAVSRQTRRLLDTAGADAGQAPVEAPLLDAAGVPDPSFVALGGYVEPRDATTFRKKPSEMLRAFSVALAHGLAVGPRAVDMISEYAAYRAADLRADPDGARRFLDVLSDERDGAGAREPNSPQGSQAPNRPAAAHSLLEEMNDVGLLAALFPDWEGVVGRVQHDLYHVYTVDQHSLYSVAAIKALVRGDPDVAKAYPTAVLAARAVKSRPLLYLAALLHDIGKPKGAGHAAKGAPLAAAVARRLGFDAGAVEDITFLVRHHLYLAHVSTRRDLEDEHLIACVATLCETEERLRMLYLVTFADLKSIGPQNLTSWKEELLRDLYRRTLTCLRRGPDLLRMERAAVVKRRKRDALEKLEGQVDRARVEALSAGLPDRYFAENKPARIAAHLALMAGRVGPCAIAATLDRDGEAELVVVADDVPGLLACIAGVLFANRVDIMTAAIASREPSASLPGAEALDVFRVRPASPSAIIDDAKVEAIRRDLTAALDGSVPVDALVAARKPPSAPFGSRPEVPDTEVKIDNEVSRDMTVIDVFAEDRPGVLYTIALTLAAQDLDIHRSKAGVEADRVADVFYVRDKRTGAKILDPARKEQIQAALVVALPSSRRNA
jgi:[protein-PII] uridylyltransferase